ncbi:uncharacterized protein SCHCODRAFT_01305834 [Schizophyllum commune H4-8]|uniref:uncharacterized protein n=1 Tax=Schizophyllum commune (strain H4-8 / FGSC 9210) TaxID=578458 RepID=UPI00215FC21E|nr:uncharacterized protein SCHCODRAFT_01305834 [Schizophyllum commune H4-8]KAI5890893.1 hypothetical protein SCHCODRAFT_01305834 [Schizophyllum commune H4-8]
MPILRSSCDVRVACFSDEVGCFGAQALATKSLASIYFRRPGEEVPCMNTSRVPRKSVIGNTILHSRFSPLRVPCFPFREEHSELSNISNCDRCSATLCLTCDCEPTAALTASLYKFFATCIPPSDLRAVSTGMPHPSQEVPVLVSISNTQVAGQRIVVSCGDLSEHVLVISVVSLRAQPGAL